MRLRLLAVSCLISAATLSAPALAHGRHGDWHERDDWRDERDADYGPDFGADYGPGFGRAQQDWLIECRERVADRSRGAPIDGTDACETALDDYYESYRPGYGPGVIMVPVVIPGRPCVETQTTEYVRPARRVIPRPAPRPDKRIRLGPDKRLPLR